ncbi:hypothetical protein GRV26_002791 [Salmonella enterica]|nr:hypothetical protein [Salmonella enterica]
MPCCTAEDRPDCRHPTGGHERCNQNAPLWQNVCIKRDNSDGRVTLTFDR